MRNSVKFMESTSFPYLKWKAFLLVPTPIFSSLKMNISFS